MAILRFGSGVVLLALLLFIPAGTVNYWQAWLYFGILFIPMILVLIYLLKNDPALLQRRLKTNEKQTRQILIVILSLPFYLGSYLLAGFDYRYQWSSIPWQVIVLTDVLIVAGYYLFFLTLKANSYASRIIEVADEQKLIDTGPYAYVRHPMYTGLLLIYVLSPIALGSWWGITASIFLPVIIILRIFNEETLLEKELSGYSEYMQRTPYRLVPYIW